MATFRLRGETDQNPTTGKHRFTVYPGEEAEDIIYRSDYDYDTAEEAEQAAIDLIRTTLAAV